MDNFLSEATQKGMYVVDNDNIEGLFDEYDEQLVIADDLCEVVDPENRPYDSKYKAREILDKLCNKLEANRTIASLEKKKATLESLDFRIAAIRIRTGTISWECEEPHNAQTDLELACEFYFPGLVKLINETSGDVLDASTENVTLDSLPRPKVPLLTEAFRADAMKCLNILGILWAGRSQVRKSFMYLLAANDFYESNVVGVAPKSRVRREMDNSFTHNLFYLAQAYGNMNDSKKSCFYCHKTLQRQLDAGLKDMRSALDWSKNCASIADFYMAMRQYNNCALALGSAEKILKDRVINELRAAAAANNSPVANEGVTSTPVNFVRGNLNAAEIEAELHRRWAILDVNILKRGYEMQNVRRTAAEMGVELTEADTHEFLHNGEEDYVVPILPGCTAPDTSAAPETVFSASTANIASTVEFFPRLPVEVVSLLSGGEVDCFERARTVFLRAVARIEAAKKYYVLDGYVTDHCVLVQEHSKLYHFLAGFEGDSKRKLAMESRRVELLLPLVRSLNRVSYEVLHKQISYELGETSLAQLEIRLDRLRGPGGEVNEKKLKRTDVDKCNECCKVGYAMFTHFAYLYAQAKDRSNSTCYTHFETLELHQLALIACMEPDETLISEEEVRPFLNSHFLAARAITKVIPAASYCPPVAVGATQPNKAHFLVAALRRYEWLSKFVPKICERRGLEPKAVFGDEFAICQDMVKLLPSKIDRMMYLGESGLSL